MSKLGLGTAQFGYKYGIANTSGKIKKFDAKNILLQAKKESIDLIDTAVSYGKSEKVIGDSGLKDFRIVSKLPTLPMNIKDIDKWLEQNVQRSLLNLNQASLYGLLVHRSKNLLGKNGKKLISSLENLKNSGLVEKIGVSIYDPSELNNVMKLTKIDIVQAPLNIVDRRFEISGWLSKLHEEKVEIHSRSVFLQGLLLLSQNKIPKKFGRWSNIFEKFFLYLKKNKVNALEACLSYPLSFSEIDKVIVGVDNINQLKKLIKISQNNLLKYDFSFMTSNDQMLINPFNWEKL
tara:strand:+ start:12197 stop:13069 length:873 start_codon:yes stop_codon:yes gene_type:complete